MAQYQRWDEKEYITCPNCASSIEASSRYCNHCGALVDKDEIVRLYYRDKQKAATLINDAPKIKKRNKSWIIYATLAVVALAFSIYASQSDVQTLPTVTATPVPVVATPSPTQAPRLTEYEFTSGRYIKKPTYECICPLTVSVPSGKNYYIYLDYIGAPAYSVVSRQKENTYRQSTDGDVSFLVGAGCTVDIDVPVGKYKLYYTCGDTWYGRDNRFGPDAPCYSSSTILDFYTDNTSAYGHTLELWLQTDGNLDRKEISPSGFPD